MKKQQYFNPGVNVDVVIFTIIDTTLSALLIKRTNEPFKDTLALPGGFLHHGETTLDAATRVLREKAGIENVYIEQLYTFDDHGRDPRGPIFSVTYFALVPEGKIKIHPSKHTQTPAFFKVATLPALAFDHKKIIAVAKKRLASKIEYTNLIFSLLPQTFTLSELQTIYEIILDKKLDKRNFRKKFLQLGLIKSTHKKQTGGRRRPAELYKALSIKTEELKKFI